MDDESEVKNGVPGYQGDDMDFDLYMWKIVFYKTFWTGILSGL